MGLSVIILAAGQGTRMKSALPKVLHQIAGRPLIRWALEPVAELAPDQVVVVVGHEADSVTQALPDGITAVVQEEQLGTGHATLVAMDALAPEAGDVVVVIPGDAPLLTGGTLAALVETHDAAGAEATLLTTDVDDPSGYGRVVRDGEGRVTGVVEDRDAGPGELAITEINAGMYAFQAGPLHDALRRLEPSNVQSELYLTDVIGILAGDGRRLEAVPAAPDEVAGVNSLAQLAAAAKVVRSRINTAWMAEGVWMLDPERVYIDAAVVVSAGARLYPGVHLEGDSAVAAGAEVGPDTHVRDSRIGEDAMVRYAVLDGAEVGARVSVGPYARLRPGTVLEAESKIGTFVETKKTRVGARSKVPHLSYMGDADIGEDVNVGAGSITCNWDGIAKHPTTIGDRAFVGSDTMLVAPVEIGEDAFTGAGSTITRDVPPAALAVERSPQRHIGDYAARRKRSKQGEG